MEGEKEGVMVKSCTGKGQSKRLSPQLGGSNCDHMKLKRVRKVQVKWRVNLI